MKLRKNVLISGIVAAVLLVVVGAAVIVARPYLRPHLTLRLGGGVFNARLAQTEAERAKGLSGVTHLSRSDAMLFVFDQTGKPVMWMKDMKIPLDMIWLDDQKKVVYIVKNADPDTYPEVFVPKNDARYVVEVAAGTVEADSIQIGQLAAFDLKQAQGGQR